MIPLPSDASAADVEQWCTRGVVMVNQAATGPVPRWFHAYDGAARTVYTTPLTPELTEPPRMRSAPDQVFVHWPRCGSVNLKRYAVFADRLAQRQYRRTWHTGGLRVSIPRGWEIGRALGYRGVPRWSAEGLAKACFFPKYPSYAEADDMLASGEMLSVAITPRVIVAGDKSGKRMFYYNGQLACTGIGGILHPAGEELSVMKIAKLVDGRFYVAYGG